MREMSVTEQRYKAVLAVAARPVVPLTHTLTRVYEHSVAQSRKAILVVVIACLLCVIPASAQASEDDQNLQADKCLVLAFAQLREQGTLLSTLEQIQKWSQEGTAFDRAAFKLVQERQGTLLTCFELLPNPWRFVNFQLPAMTADLSYDPVTHLEQSIYYQNTSLPGANGGYNFCETFTLIDHNGTTHNYGPFGPGSSGTVDISSFGDYVNLTVFQPRDPSGLWYFDFIWRTQSQTGGGSGGGC